MRASRRSRTREEARPARGPRSGSRSGPGARSSGRRAPHERAGVSYADGSSLVLEPGSPGFERLARASRAPARRGRVTRRRARRARSSSGRCSRATSSSARAGARRGTSTSTASRPSRSSCARSASASPRPSREYEPDAVRLAGPALGGVALAASAAMASGLPFIIVRGETKEYGTANTDRGPVRAGRAGVPPRGRRHVRRRARGGGVGSPRRGARRPQCRLCGRSGGGRIGRSRAPRRATRGRSFGPASFWSCEKPPENSMVEPNPKGC